MPVHAGPAMTTTEPAAPPQVGRVARVARLAHAAWLALCLGGVVGLVGVRWLRYAVEDPGPRLDVALARAMIFVSQTFLWSWAYTTREAGTVALAIAVMVAGLHRRLPGRIAHRAGGVWRLRPAVVTLACLGLLIFNYLLDVNPTIARVCAESLLLITVTSHPRVARALPRALRLLLWVGAIVYWLVAARDPIDRTTLLVWLGLLLATEHWLAGRMIGRHVALLRLVAVMPMNLLPAVLPLLVPPAGGLRIGSGLAYSFCETADGKRLFAALPTCNSVQIDYEHCRDAGIAEYDAVTLRRTATHHFFSPSYYGRFEMLLCLDDRVLATIHETVRDGQTLGETVLAFPPESPDEFDADYARGMGATIAYDAAHDAIFYSGEFNHRVVRYSRATGRTKLTRDSDLRNDWVQPIALARCSGSQSLDTRSIHPGRNRIYVTQWMQGRYVHAIDLTTLNVVARYDVGGGGALGLAVDPERDRLFVSSLWGLEVFDLRTDRLVARRRMGLANRPVILDATRNRLYLSSTVEGKIRVLDRDTFDVVGQIPIGVGSRFAHLSRDAKRFFASSVVAHYAWDADALAGT